VEEMLAGMRSEMKMELTASRKHVDGEIGWLRGEMHKVAKQNAEVHRASADLGGDDGKKQTVEQKITFEIPISEQLLIPGVDAGEDRVPDSSPAISSRDRDDVNTVRRQSIQLRRVSAGVVRRRSVAGSVPAMSMPTTPTHDTELQRILNLAFKMQNARPALEFNDPASLEKNRKNRRASSCPPPPLTDAIEDVSHLSEDALRLRSSHRLFIRLIRRALFGIIDGYPEDDEIGAAQCASPESPKRTLTRQQLEELAGTGDDATTVVLPSQVPRSKARDDGSSFSSSSECEGGATP